MASATPFPPPRHNVAIPRRAFRACYSTPFVLERPGTSAELIVGSTAGLTGYNPHTGEVIWDWTWALR